MRIERSEPNQNPLRYIRNTLTVAQEIRYMGGKPYSDKYGKDIRNRLNDARKHAVADVVIPVLNEEDFLAATLDTLSKQTIPLNVIVVDNGSKDESPTIATTMGVQILREATPGIGAAKKGGLLKTTLPFVLMTDADTIQVPTWAETLVNRLSDPDSPAVVYSPSLYHDADTVGLKAYNAAAISARWVKSRTGKPHYQGNSCAFSWQIRDMMSNEEHLQAGEGGRIYKTIKANNGTVAWIWSPEALVFTSCRRVKTHGLLPTFTRRAIHLSLGNSDAAYDKLYKPAERGYNS